MPPENTQGEVSAFNEGALQIQRIHILQDGINRMNSNPLYFNPMINKYNFEVIFSNLCSLFSESSSKLSKKELEDGLKKRKEIKEHLQQKPVYSIEYDEENHKRTLFKQQNWEELQELLFSYEIMIRKLLEDHNLTAPKGESPDFAAYS